MVRTVKVHYDLLDPIIHYLKPIEASTFGYQWMYSTKKWRMTGGAKALFVCSMIVSHKGRGQKTWIPSVKGKRSKSETSLLCLIFSHNISLHPPWTMNIGNVTNLLWLNKYVCICIRDKINTNSILELLEYWDFFLPMWTCWHNWCGAKHCNALQDISISVMVIYRIENINRVIN